MVWNNDKDGNISSFVRMVHIFADKTTILLKAIVTIPIPEHICFPTVPGSIVDIVSISAIHVLIFSVLLPQSKSYISRSMISWSANRYGSNDIVILADEMPQTLQANRRDARIYIFHKAIQKILYTMRASLWNWIRSHYLWHGTEVSSGHLFSSFWYSRRNDISVIKHDATARSCVQWLISWNDIIHPKKRNRWDGRDRKKYTINWKILKVDTFTCWNLENNEKYVFKNLHFESTMHDSPSLSKTGNLLSKLNLTNGVWQNNEYSVLNVESFHQ